ncbi:5'/3'-nucleotidase SurE [Microbacterium testaceum]|uniref:5'/3'-nucleotidase SurE n=1 Tax=Microbacterium testaceum TaxID=2033 RepID=UPI00073404EA|nr:5'/3'-nucleotidase SurE [Microbacterium testaceum]
MRILLTNDDGVGAPGNVVLAQALLDAGHDVAVVGPLGERSGSGTAIGTIEHGARIGVRDIALETTPPLTGTALDAPPALAVLTALGGLFGARPDLVVSGVNPGHNVGRSVVFSGTVGACLAATTLGMPSLAVSCGFAPEHRFDTAAAIAVAGVEWFGEAGMPRVCVNINVPDLDRAELRGVRKTTFAFSGMFTLDMRREGGELVIQRGASSPRNVSGSDLEAVRDGYVAVSLLRPMDVDVAPAAVPLADGLVQALAAPTAHLPLIPAALAPTVEGALR